MNSLLHHLLKYNEQQYILISKWDCMQIVHQNYNKYIFIDIYKCIFCRSQNTLRWRKHQLKRLSWWLDDFFFFWSKRVQTSKRMFMCLFVFVRVFLAEQFDSLQAHLDSMMPAVKKPFLQQFYSQVRHRSPNTSDVMPNSFPWLCVHQWRYSSVTVSHGGFITGSDSAVSPMVFTFRLLNLA